MDRLSLGFVRRVLAEFSFLITDFDCQLVEKSSSRIRYATDSRFIDISHGRNSYELHVEIGRWITVNDQVVEQKFPLPDVASRLPGGKPATDNGATATTPESVDKFVRSLAELTKNAVPIYLATDDTPLDILRQETERWSQEHLESVRAARLRNRADLAWRNRDFGIVVNSYSEIDQELHTVTLRQSEEARLRYALNHLNENG